MKSKQQKLIESARGAINTALGANEGYETDKEWDAIEEGFNALQEMQRHEKRKVGRRYRGVSEKEWKKWNADEREVFNLINRVARYVGQAVLSEDSRSFKLTQKEFKALIHNLAFVVTSEMRSQRLHKENPKKY
jgi:hypothetical protein